MATGKLVGFLGVEKTLSQACSICMDLFWNNEQKWTRGNKGCNERYDLGRGGGWAEISATYSPPLTTASSFPPILIFSLHSATTQIHVFLADFEQNNPE
jgi:hypothetical protein